MNLDLLGAWLKENLTSLLTWPKIRDRKALPTKPILVQNRPSTKLVVLKKYFMVTNDTPNEKPAISIFFTTLLLLRCRYDIISVPSTKKKKATNDCVSINSFTRMRFRRINSGRKWLLGMYCFLHTKKKRKIMPIFKHCCCAKTILKFSFKKDGFC